MNIYSQPKIMTTSIHRSFRTIFSGSVLTLLATALLLTSCATREKFVTSTVVPAAVGEVKVKKDDNNNYRVEISVENMINEANHNLWEAIAEWEFLLEQKSLFKRVQEQKKLRESKHVEIVAYKPEYQTAFKALNEEWISSYFEMEEADYKALDNPEEYILSKGGKIFVALYNGEALGVCALIKMNDPDYEFEMAKMAVSPKAQGKNMGWLLGQAIINAAKELGASKIYLESNTALKPAINLYNKLGFQKIFGRPTPYKRANIQMELNLNIK
ncbi:MAG: GNAT family N-acetyltransferase [Sphingobacteriales bacterium]|nr:MAG: GNAT family N-acetyltransferase [Sphingobacteriales bacterium]